MCHRNYYWYQTSYINRYSDKKWKTIKEVVFMRNADASVPIPPRLWWKGLQIFMIPQSPAFHRNLGFERFHPLGLACIVRPPCRWEACTVPVNYPLCLRSDWLLGWYPFQFRWLEPSSEIWRLWYDYLPVLSGRQPLVKIWFFKFVGLSFPVAAWYWLAFPQ